MRYLQQNTDLRLHVYASARRRCWREKGGDVIDISTQLAVVGGGCVALSSRLGLGATGGGCRPPQCGRNLGGGGRVVLLLLAGGTTSHDKRWPQANVAKKE